MSSETVGSTRANYIYIALGQLIEKTVGGVTTLLMYDHFRFTAMAAVRGPAVVRCGVILLVLYGGRDSAVEAGGGI